MCIIIELIDQGIGVFFSENPSPVSYLDDGMGSFELFPQSKISNFERSFLADYKNKQNCAEPTDVRLQIHSSLQLSI